MMALIQKWKFIFVCVAPLLLDSYVLMLLGEVWLCGLDIRNLLYDLICHVFSIATILEIHSICPCRSRLKTYFNDNLSDILVLDKR
jgi:hypothetical protein